MTSVSEKAFSFMRSSLQWLTFLPAILLMVFLYNVSHSAYQTVQVNDLIFELPSTWYSETITDTWTPEDSDSEILAQVAESLPLNFLGGSELRWIASEYGFTQIPFITVWEFPDARIEDVAQREARSFYGWDRTLDESYEISDMTVHRIDLQSDYEEGEEFRLHEIILIIVNTGGETDYLFSIFGYGQNALSEQSETWEELIESLRLA